MVRTRHTALCMWRARWTLRAKTQDLARPSFQSRTQFHRLVPNSGGKNSWPFDAAIVLSAAQINWRLPESVTNVALDAQLRRCEAFTPLSERTFSDFSHPLVAYGDPHFHLPASKQTSLFALFSSTKGGRDMDLSESFAGTLLAHTRRFWNTRVL